MRIELILGPVKRGTASFANVRAGFEICLMLSAERTLCSFVNDDLFFLRGKLVVTQKCCQISPIVPEPTY